MVKEWDDASRGKKLPEKVANSAQHVVQELGKIAAAASMTLGAKPTSTVPKLPGLKPAGPMKAPNVPSPGDYKPSFLDNSGAAAQRGSEDKLNAGNTLTMPT
jgi:hypothetical protein